MFSIKIRREGNLPNPDGPDRLAMEILNRSVQAALIQLDMYTPVDTGALKNAVMYHEWARPYGGGYSAGVGDVSRMGDADARSPKGTIREFLDWYRGTQGEDDEDRKRVAKARVRRSWYKRRK